MVQARAWHVHGDARHLNTIVCLYCWQRKSFANIRVRPGGHGRLSSRDLDLALASYAIQYCWPYRQDSTQLGAKRAMAGDVEI